MTAMVTSLRQSTKAVPISHPMMSVPTSWPLETSQATIHQQKEVSRQVKILGANISVSTSAATPIPVPMKYISQPVTTTITNTWKGISEELATTPERKSREILSVLSSVTRAEKNSLQKSIPAMSSSQPTITILSTNT